MNSERLDIELLFESLGVQGQEFKTFNKIINIDETKWDFNEENIERFNRLYQALSKSNLHQAKLTPSGDFSSSKYNQIWNSYSWTYSNNGTGSKIIMVVGVKVYKVNLRSKTSIELSGYKAYQKFKYIVENKFKIKLDSYKCSKEKGLEWKEKIPKPRIYFKERFKRKILKNVHHIDFHSSWPAGIVKNVPSLAPVFKYLYENRKEHPEYKDIMNKTIGYFQSKNVNYGYSELAYWAISDNEERIAALTTQLEEAGRTIIGYNTDGIWYQGEIFHGKGEGPYMGYWENDHSPDLFRAWSDGAYEYASFRSDGTLEVTPILRGTCKMDKIEPDRSKWKWGDIVKYRTYEYKWDDEVGIVSVEM